jgi:RNA polymerase sigma-70 factor (ECF subfamily)
MRPKRCNPAGAAHGPGTIVSELAATTGAPDAAADADDRRLVRRAVDGDLHAFERLVERHRDVVARVAGRIAGFAEADDVSQDAFLRAFHRLARFRGEAPFRSWLLRIAHNAALDHLARRRAEPIDPETLEASVAEGARRPPAEQLELRERIDRLERKLMGLTPPHRAVLVLRDVEGFGYDEVAEVTETPIGTVKGRLHRARRELIAILRANTYDWELPV